MDRPFYQLQELRTERSVDGVTMTRFVSPGMTRFVSPLYYCSSSAYFFALNGR